MVFHAADIKVLRQRTGAGILDCKKALVEADETSTRQSIGCARGVANAAKAGRIASEGIVTSYIHAGGKSVSFEVNCETDFVAINEGFQGLCRDIAMHIAATAQYVSGTGVRGRHRTQRQVQLQRVIEEGKPEHIAEKIVAGAWASTTKRSASSSSSRTQEDRR